LLAAAAIADAVAGADLLGLDLKTHGPAVLLAGEDPDEAIHHRLHALATHLSNEKRESVAERLHIIPCLGDGVDISDPEWLELIHEQAEGTRILIVDTLTRFHSLDENSAKDAKIIMSSLEQIARKTGCSILYLHHVNKSSAMNGMAELQQAARGSSVFVDNARWLAFIAGMSEAEAKSYGIDAADRHFYVRWNISKQNYGPPQQDKWLKRHEGGILMAVNLAQKVEDIQPNNIINGSKKWMKGMQKDD